jgi:hypothetical protein
VIRSEELDPVERYPRVAAQRLAPCLGFDGEDTARADEHMVEIEAIGQHVVEGLIPLLAKPVQELADRSLTVDAQAQGAQPRAKANDRQAAKAATAAAQIDINQGLPGQSQRSVLERGTIGRAHWV